MATVWALMQEAFGIVLFVVVAVAIVVAAIAISGTGNLYKQIGRGGLSLDRDSDHVRPVRSGGATSRAEADEEVRQMLEARNARRVARGEAPLDVEAEIARLSAPVIDPGLEAEIRSMVIARNERRERQGKPPLDVEDEVRRQIAELGGAAG
jgi:hypothetical protein